VPARILSGHDAAAELRAEVAGRVGALAADGARVGLATVLVGDDPASQIYVRNKHVAAQEVGMRSFDHALPADSSQDEVESLIDSLNADPDVTAFLVQLPLPEHLSTVRVLERIDPRKDADGLHPHNQGRMVLGLPGPRPATPSGILRLLDHHGIAIPGSNAVVVGRSALVGRPLSILLSARPRNATVTLAHTGTADLTSVTSRADLLIVAAGSPGLIGSEHVKPGAVVIDVGTTRVDAGLTGDVRFDEVVDIVSAISPVPGGVGPMTIAGLLANAVLLADAR
jgi:methylenetetrahydrofolate dehydrogenase (NADP+)/methenyltetrahydrofolate cyclohydrolase